MKMEAAVDREIRAYLNTVAFCHGWKTTPGLYGQAGTQDWIICYRGVFLGVETKRPNVAPRFKKAQPIVRLRTLEAGGISLVVQSLAEVQTAMERIKELQPIEHAHALQAALGLRDTQGLT